MNEIKTFIIVYETNDTANSDYLMGTETEAINHMGSMADEFFNDNPDEIVFSVCLIDFICNNSTIYEYEAKREVTISCTIY